MTDFPLLLKQLGLKVTPKRLAILEIMLAAETYLRPEEIQAALRPRLGTIGLSTVYRNLEELAGGGVISRIHLPDRQLSYYFCPNPGHHHHFVCRDCRRVSDLADCGCERLDSRVDGEVETHIIQAIGRCRSCLAFAAAS